MTKTTRKLASLAAITVFSMTLVIYTAYRHPQTGEVYSCTTEACTLAV